MEPIVQDLAVAGAATALFARIPDCDVLINNAGFASNGRFDRIPEDRIRQELLIDVVTLTELTRKYPPSMIQRGAGRILNIASTAAFLLGPFMAVYYAAKAYVLSFSEALSEELHGTGVTVTCLCPGATATGFVDRAEMRDSPLFKMPLADPIAVAKAGYAGMLRGKRLIVPGLSNKLVALSPRITPRNILLKLSRKLVEPPNKERS